MAAALAALLLFAPIGAAPRVLFLNRAGGAFAAAGPEDARADRSPALGHDGVLSPFAHGDAAWAELVACVKERYRWFDLQIVERDPGDAPHVECVVAGTPDEVGLSAGTGGVGRVHCGATLEHPLVFAFAGTRAPNELGALCEGVAHEIGHAFGLDHVLACEDPMSYATGCGEKHFQAPAAPCGEGAPRACACGGDAQASFPILQALLGGAPPAPPSVTLVAPSDGARVAAPVTVEIAIAGPAAPRRVDLYLDGARVASRPAAPFVFTLAAPLDAGPLRLEARLLDLLGRAAAAAGTVHVAEPVAPPPAGCSFAPGAPAASASCLVLFCAGLLLRGAHARGRRCRWPWRTWAAGCGRRRSGWPGRPTQG